MSPLIERIEGIRIEMYSREHYPAHIHVKYGGDEVIIDIENMEVLVGEIPIRKMKVVERWLSDTTIQKDLIELFYFLNKHLRHEKK